MPVSYTHLQDGFGLWAVIHKSDAALIGQCGITLQDCNGCTVHEVGSVSYTHIDVYKSQVSAETSFVKVACTFVGEPARPTRFLSLIHI